MWMLSKRFTFEASHQLPFHDGKCARLHGHSWVGWLLVQGDTLHTTGPKQGMVVDYGDLSDALAPLLTDYLDHWHLNDTTGLESPTSEALAQWIYERTEPWVEGLVAVRLEETCTSACEYRP